MACLLLNDPSMVCARGGGVLAVAAMGVLVIACGGGDGGQDGGGGEGTGTGGADETGAADGDQTTANPTGPGDGPGDDDAGDADDGSESGGPSGCVSDDDCPSGTECTSNGTCVPWCNVGCCDPDGDCDWNECDEADCEVGELCPYDDSFNKVFCEPLPAIEACDGTVQVAAEVVFEDATAVVRSVAFVGAEDGVGEDLLVGSADGATLVHDSADSTELAVDGAEAVLATSADFDGDGDEDIVVALDNGGGSFELATLLNNDAGGYTPAFTIPGPGSPSVIRAIDLGDSAPGLAVLNADGEFFRYPGGNGGNFSNKEPWRGWGVNTFAVGSADGEGTDDPAFDLETGGAVRLELDDGLVDAGLGQRGPRSLAFGTSDRDDQDDLYLHTALPQWTLLETVTEGGTTSSAYALMQTSTFAAAGDLDGNGRTDMLLVSGDDLLIVWGDDSGGLGCADTLPMAAQTGNLIAVGDWTGTGVDQIVIGDPTRADLLTLE